jgi:hypothetical protein
VPRDQEDSSLARRHLERAPDERAERAADLHRRSLSAPRATEAERQHRSNGLHERDAAANDPVAAVEGFDDRV